MKVYIKDLGMMCDICEKMVKNNMTAIRLHKKICQSSALEYDKHAVYVRDVNSSEQPCTKYFDNGIRLIVRNEV